MQRAIVLRPPYGTKLVQQKDGSIWLYYDSVMNPVENICNWLRDVALEHQAQAKISDTAIEARKKVLSERKSKATEHDWGGDYRLAATCKKCGVMSDGLESATCKPDVVIDPKTIKNLKDGIKTLGIDPDANPGIAKNILELQNTLPSQEGEETKGK